MWTVRNRVIGLALLAICVASTAHASMLARAGGSGHSGSIGGGESTISERSGGGPLGEQNPNRGTDYGFNNEGWWWGGVNMNPQNPNRNIDFNNFGAVVPSSNGSYYGVPGGNSSSVDTYVVPYGE